jgi:hypothetical protein
LHITNDLSSLCRNDAASAWPGEAAVEKFSVTVFIRAINQISQRALRAVDISPRRTALVDDLFGLRNDFVFAAFFKIGGAIR